MVDSLTSAAQPDSAQEWNLSDLYQGFDDPQFTSDLDNLRQSAIAFRDQHRGNVAELDAAALTAALKELEAIALCLK